MTDRIDTRALRAALFRDGYTVFRHTVPAERCQAVLDAIAQDLDISVEDPDSRDRVSAELDPTRNERRFSARRRWPVSTSPSAPPRACRRRGRWPIRAPKRSSTSATGGPSTTPSPRTRNVFHSRAGRDGVVQEGVEGIVRSIMTLMEAVTTPANPATESVLLGDIPSKIAAAAKAEYERRLRLGLPVIINLGNGAEDLNAHHKQQP